MDVPVSGACASVHSLTNCCTAHNGCAAPEKIRSPAALSLPPVALAAASATAQVTPRLVSREVQEFSFHLRSRADSVFLDHGSASRHCRKGTRNNSGGHYSTGQLWLHSVQHPTLQAVWVECSRRIGAHQMVT